MTDTLTIKRGVDLAAVIEAALGPGRRVGRSTMWPCPFHEDSTPSLSVKRGEHGDYYHCFGCGAGGDAITFMQRHYRLTFIEALRRLGGDNTITVSDPRPPVPPAPRTPPEADWQAAAREITERGMDRLCSPAGSRARDWLHARGLTDNTLRSYNIGYSQGMTVRGIYVEPGIIIPGYDCDHYWYIKVRRASGEPKYRKVRGSTSGLFGQHPRIWWSQDIFLTEGEMDCMLLWQECYDITNVATFGSASDRIDPHTWGGPLSQMEQIYLCYDMDPAGNMGALDMMLKTGRAHSCRIPDIHGHAVKDLTDYYLAGGDLRAWAWYQIRGGAA